jgi:hypothetical protein
MSQGWCSHKNYRIAQALRALKPLQPEKHYWSLRSPRLVIVQDTTQDKTPDTTPWSREVDTGALGQARWHTLI